MDNSRTFKKRNDVSIEQATLAMALMPERLRNWLTYDASLNWDPAWCNKQYVKLTEHDCVLSNEAVTAIIKHLKAEERADLRQLMKMPAKTESK